MDLELVFRDDPDRVDYARNVAKDRKQDVNPEVLANTNLQEHAQGWEKYRDNDT